MSTLEQYEAMGVEKGLKLGLEQGMQKVLEERKNAVFKELRTLVNLLKRLPDLSSQELAIITLIDEQRIAEARTLLKNTEIAQIKIGLIDLFFKELPFKATDESLLEEIIRGYLA